MNRAALMASVLAAAVACSWRTLASSSDLDQLVSVSWRLVENYPDGHFTCALRLHNEGHATLPDRWELYFNCPSKLTKQSTYDGLELSHVNGDLYVLRPGISFKPILPGDVHEFQYEGRPWAINISDAPSGFYIVQPENDHPISPPTPIECRIEPFPPDPLKLRRGASDEVPVASSESRFRQNESLRLLPPGELIKVIPTPSQITKQNGDYVLSGATRIIFEPALFTEARFLADSLSHLLSTEVAIEENATSTRPKTNTIRLRIAPVQVAGKAKKFGDEAYTLDIRPTHGIEIVGSDSAGVFYGIQSLRALLPIELWRANANEVSIKSVHIGDAPRFQYRGLHLDVARNFQQPDTVMKLLDVMAFYKLNRFHWHLTDDEGWRIQIKALPELTAVGARRGHSTDESDRLIPSHGSGPAPDPNTSQGSGFYTQQQLVEILRYAGTRHIEVIPELDFPGHARAAIKSMEARHARQPARSASTLQDPLLREPNDASQYESVQMWRDNVVDVGRDETYRFLDIVTSELADIFKRAGLTLNQVHLGGDEVPKGAWDKSAACARIVAEPDSKMPRSSQLERYFLERAASRLSERSIRPACWEDCLLLDPRPWTTNADVARSDHKPLAYVWNNVWGWGREDAAYRLANAGYDIVLCNATHLYFDLACEKDPQEPGYYWAGFVGMRAPFEFNPLNVFQNAENDGMGRPLRPDSFKDRTRLSAEGMSHIIGIQGQLWGENLRGSNALEYMAFPRIIALAERAWAAPPAWVKIEDVSTRREACDRDWNQFANRLGQRELPRLDSFAGGIRYRIPPPGLNVTNGIVHANTSFPGLEIRYTTDGSEPDRHSTIYAMPIPWMERQKFKAFSTQGRGSRSATASNRGPGDSPNVLQNQ